MRKAIDKFLQEYVKELIIDEFISWSILNRSQDLVYLREIADNKPIMTTAAIDGLKIEDCDSIVKFSLTNVIYYNKFKGRIERYAISGLLSQLDNTHRIIINSFDVEQ